MSGLDHQILQMLRLAGYTLKSQTNGADKVKATITKNSIGAAAASLAAGWLPGVGAVAATGISVAFIWAMYYGINKTLGISISKNKLKSLASALLSNILVGLGGVVLIEVTAAGISLIPGIGSVSASIILAAVNYGLVYVSGLIYIKMLTELFKAKQDITEMSEDELKAKATDVFNNNKKEFQEEFKNARADARKKIKAGEITKEDKFEPDSF